MLCNLSPKNLPKQAVSKYIQDVSIQDFLAIYTLVPRPSSNDFLLKKAFEKGRDN